MKFPDERLAKYEACAMTIGETARGIGLDIRDDLLEKWVGVIGRLATADELAETDPTTFDDPQGLLEHLQIPREDRSKNLVSISGQLVTAAARSDGANTICAHFDSRGDEAVCSMELLRWLSPAAISAKRNEWQQLGFGSMLGTYLDSFFDAPTDALRLTQFTVSELRRGAAQRSLETAKRIYPVTWRAGLRATTKYGLTQRVARKLPAALFDTLRQR